LKYTDGTIFASVNGSRTIGWFGAAVPLLSFLTLGMPAGALGVAWPFMRTSLAAPLAGLGLLLAAWTVAYFLASASTGSLTGRLGPSTLLISGCSLAAIGLFGLSIASQWWMVPAVTFLIGGGSGLIDATTNAQTSLHRSVGYMGWLHASWAVGAAIGPQLVTLSLTFSHSWRLAFAMMAVAFFGVGIVLVWRANDMPRSAAREAISRSPVSESWSLRRPVLLLAALFLMGGGLEATAGDWAYTQLTLGRGLATELASLATSLFWAGLGVGRVALGLLGNRISPTAILDGSVALTVFAALAFWLAPPAIAAFVALPLLGVAVSLFFPLLLSLTPQRVGTALTSHAIGYGLAAGNIGAGGLPAASGIVLQALGVTTLGPLLAAMSGGLVALHIVSRRSAD
jgi:fucose permease